MATQIQTSELDFDTIKKNLIAYLQTKPEFADYDFSASGLSHIIDMLVYNTHQLAKITNFGLNESFLDTAQLRSSIVSHAKNLGYIPRSRLSAQAKIDVAAVNVPASTPTLTLPAYTKFTTTIDNKVYSFFTLSEYTATENDGYIFKDVIIYEGVLKTKKFFIDADENDYPIYVIPDKNMDRTTLSVILRDGVSSTSITSLALANDLSTLDKDSDIYLINEAPNGNWEISLGDGIIGKKPKEGAVLEATYIISSGSVVNGTTVFNTTAKVSGYSLSISLKQKAYGGSEKENEESIRFNAPLTFASQNRLVTVEDYKSYIANNTSFIETVNIWNGAEDPNPEYGKVFISAKPYSGNTLTDSQKSAVSQLIDKKSVISIVPKFVDPEFEYLDIDCNVIYDSTKTSLSKKQLETAINNVIEQYETDTLITFSSVFRKSNLLTKIDSSDIAIKSSDMNVKIRKRFFPTLGVNDKYDLFYSSKIKNPADTTKSILTSTAFTYTVDGTNYSVFLRNNPGTTTIELYRLVGSQIIIILPNAGSIDLSTNKVTIGPFNPTAFINTTKGIEVIAELADDQEIKPTLNILLKIDENATSINAIKEV